MNNPDQTPPHSVEAEEGVLGSILIAPEIFPSIASVLKASDFFIARHMWIWDVFVALVQQGLSIDSITAMQELRQRKQLEDVGGPAYITYLINNTPTHIHAESYAQLVSRAAQRRRLLNVAGNIAAMALEEQSTISEVLEKAETQVLELTRVSNTHAPHSIQSSLDEHWEDTTQRVKAFDTGVAMTGIPFGFNDIDMVTGGAQDGDMIVVGARPGMGKTSFLLCCALNAVKLQPELNVLIASSEMSEKQLLNRLISMESGIPSQKIRSGNMSERELSEYYAANGRLGHYNIFIDDTPNMPILSLRAKARELKKQGKLDVIYADYLQLFTTSTRHNSRVEAVTEISHSLKGLARELNVPLMTAAQLNRQVEGRQDKHPELSDLAECGAIEQDSDVIMFIFRDDYYNENSERPNQADIDVAKQRNGPTGINILYFRKELTQFMNMNKSSVDLKRYSPAYSGNGYHDD